MTTIVTLPDKKKKNLSHRSPFLLLDQNLLSCHPVHYPFPYLYHQTIKNQETPFGGVQKKVFTKDS